MHSAVTEPNAGVLERIDQAAQRPILRPWHGVGRAFPSAQAITMDPGAGGELVLTEMGEDTPGRSNHV